MKVYIANTQASQVAVNKNKDVSSDKADAAKNKNGSLAELGTSSKVNVSDRAHMMQKAKEIASTDNVNEARVAELQKLIDSGKYDVNASAIADRMVDEQLMMNE